MQEHARKDGLSRKFHASRRSSLRLPSCTSSSPATPQTDISSIGASLPQPPHSNAACSIPCSEAPRNRHGTSVSLRSAPRASPAKPSKPRTIRRRSHARSELLLTTGRARGGASHALPPRGCRAPTPLSLLLLHLLHLPLLLLQQLLLLLELLELLLLGPRHPLSLGVLRLSLLLLLTPPAATLKKQRARQAGERQAKQNDARQK